MSFSRNAQYDNSVVVIPTEGRYLYKKMMNVEFEGDFSLLSK